MLPATEDFCRLILLRHPELDPAYATLAVGSGDAGIGRRGQGQVLEWLDRLDVVEVSEVHAARQQQCLDPARALAAKKQVELFEDGRLDDQAMGEWQGRPWDELVKSQGTLVGEFLANLGEAVAPGGESLGQAVERMLAWWHEVAPRSLHKTLAVVTSGAMISGFTSAMLGMRLSRCFSLNLPHAGVGVLDCYQNGVRVTSWNPGAL